MVCRQERAVKPGLVLFGETSCYMARGPPGLAGDLHRLRANLHKGAGSGLHELQDGRIFGRKNGSPGAPPLGTKHSARRPTTGLPQGGNSFSQRTLRRDVCQEIGYSWQDPTLARGRDITETGKRTRVCAKGHPLFCCCLALGECCGLRGEVFVVFVGVQSCAVDFVWGAERCGSRLVEVRSGLP